MHTALVLSILAVVAALLVLVQNARDPFRIAAMVVAGVEVLVAFEVVHLSISGISLRLVLGGALAALGVFLWIGNATKTTVTGCTAMALVGALQLLAAIR